MNHDTGDIYPVETTSIREPAVEPNRRAHPRTPTFARFILSVGLDRSAAVGPCTVVEISAGGALLEPDPIVFDLFRDFRVRRSLIMLGASRWNKRFALAGEVVRIDKQGRVGVSLSSSTSDAFLSEWIERGARR